jgi:GNAT superfamily N-acetyltransferase
VEGPPGGTEGEDRLGIGLPNANDVLRSPAAGAESARYPDGVNVEIRDAVERDAEALAPLIEQLMHKPQTPQQIRMRLGRLAGTGVDRVLVAVVDGRVAGVAGVTYAWLLHADAPTARLMSIVVDEGCRGQGIGRRLVEASVEQARIWGCDRIELTSRLERGAAHSFYEAVGFEHTSKRFSMPVRLSPS